MRFSILIPSFNRAEYLRHTLESCRMQNFENAEFIVMDDASTDSTPSIVNGFVCRDERFIYVRSKENRGMLVNFETGLEKCSGDYVLALGSDDALMPGCLEYIDNFIQENEFELLTWPTAAFFYRGTRDSFGQLVMPRMKKQADFEVIRSSEFLKKQTSDLHYVSDHDCPMIYVKGIASRKLIDRVKARSGGRFYSCSTPDGYSGIVLAGEVESFAKINKILTLHGVSPSSAGVNYVSTGENNTDLSGRFFENSASRPLHEKLGTAPYSPLISIMTADFLLTAKDLPGWPGHVDNVDIRRVVDKALREAADGLMDESKALRELKIISIICSHTALDDFFEQRIKKVRRNFRKTLKGDAISPRLVYLDASASNMPSNVVEAGFFVREFKGFLVAVGFRRFVLALINSAIYFVRGHLKGPTLHSLLDEKKSNAL